MSASTLLSRWTAAAGLTVGVLAGGAALAGAATNTSTSPSDESSEICTDKQKEGGYEEIDGRCQLTGFNWEFGGLCPGQRDAEVGRLGDGDCGPTDPGGPDGPVGPGHDPWEPPVGDFFTPPSFGAFEAWCAANGGTLTGELDDAGPMWRHCTGTGRDIFCSDLDGVGTEEPIVCYDSDVEPEDVPHEYPAPPDPVGPVGTEIDVDVPTKVDPSEPTDPTAPFEHEAPADPVTAGEPTTPATNDSPTVDGVAISDVTVEHRSA